MPEPKSMLEATSEANNLASLSEAKDHYISSMEAVCGGDKPYLSEAALEAQHGRVRDGAIEVFNGKRKMGGEEFSAKYRHQLEREIDESFENFKYDKFYQLILRSTGMYSSGLWPIEPQLNTYYLLFLQIAQ